MSIEEKKMLDSWRNPSQRAKNKQQGSEDPWFAVSLRPENFIPGLIVGFLLGLFMDFSRPTKPKSLSNNLTKRQQLASNSGADEELKMVLVVRQDLKMGAGKIASQCAHAATGMYAEFMQSHRSLLRQWEQYGQPKIVVTCKNQQEMNKLKQVADSIGLPTFVVADAGRTQVMAGSKTVLAIGPGRKSSVDSVTGKLRLL
ncbi:peptidyl-tRNA hydrolase 2, mitochondrial isoform X1 [Cinnamomum micranthum f. kanehirae]|uniref:peptidyl-tRNA hydrolase n=1 Tax=Cinnamomum micranthum f. kanehirae TaxID=337451 RepID=A0A443NW12_9MAGN|nr:peptidyl-tRNA hydrolase 2, mitochondrial isoform X1 [Cinnamomum micranthum f. kanehirae]